MSSLEAHTLRLKIQRMNTAIEKCAGRPKTPEEIMYIRKIAMEVNKLELEGRVSQIEERLSQIDEG